MGSCESLPFSFRHDGSGLNQGKWPVPDLSSVTERDCRKASGLGGEMCEWLAVLGCACPSTCVSHPRKPDQPEPLEVVLLPDT